MTAPDYVARLSGDRLKSYLAACNNDLPAAMRLYEWNCAVSGAFYETLGDVEVVLRNALHDQLTQWHVGPGEWYDDPRQVLTTEAHDNIANARKRIAQQGKPETPGQVVSELTFGFWRYLLIKRYKPTLWKDALRHGFPHLPAEGNPDKLFQRTGRLLVLRNRVAHHEQIHTRKLDYDLIDCRVLVAAICPDTAAWLMRRQRVSNLLAARP